MAIDSLDGAEALGQMFEVSGQIRTLDKLIQFADTFLAARDNPTTGRVLWTGRRELAWPNKSATDAEARYSATENGDVVAHIAPQLGPRYSQGRVSEDTAHGAYDILGLYRAFSRAKYQVPRARVATFARTLNLVLDTGTNLYSN